MKKKPLVVIGLLGPTLDAGQGAARWERWRPTVGLCQQETLVISRLEVLHQRRFQKLADTITEDISAISPETTVREHLVEFENPWDLEEVYVALLDFAKNYPFHPEKEEYLIHITTGTHIAQICLFLLTEAHYFPAKLIQTSPPPRKQSGGPGPYEIIDLDLSKYDKLASRFRQEQKEALSFLKSGIPTRNAAFNHLVERIEQVAIRSQNPILIMGQTGAGKSRLAKRIYELKKSRHQIQGAFVEVNCATLTSDNAMSTLFGHVKGAFTGAHRDRPGLLVAANEGILFLDEIGTLGIDEQAMLLRALEEKVFLPLGGDHEVRSNFQLLSGTNSNLQQMVHLGKFRDDLLARVNLWTFNLPGLQDRPEDLEPNLQFELEQYAQQVGTHVSFNKEARKAFLTFAMSPAATWPGNFRDLNGAVVRMATLASGGRISVELVEEEIFRLQQAWKPSANTSQKKIGERLLGQEEWEKLDLFDQLQLEGVLHICKQAHTLSDAGRKLFTSCRTRKRTVNDADRLRKYLSRLGLDWERIKISTTKDSLL